MNFPAHTLTDFIFPWNFAEARMVMHGRPMSPRPMSPSGYGAVYGGYGAGFGRAPGYGYGWRDACFNI
jgi:hypothetical protein